MDVLIDASALMPVAGDKKGKSSLEGIKGVKANVTTPELLEIIREGREGSDYFKEKY